MKIKMVKNGDTVQVHYTGTLNDGTVFDSSEGREPLQFTAGEHSMIAGFEKAVYGMEVGQTKKVTIPANEAYGQHREDMILEVGRDRLPPGMNPQVGEQLQMRDQSGGARIVTVTRLSEGSITLDANHPLAGKDLTFEIKLVEVKS
jgi:peptidylprolyl isomerase